MQRQAGAARARRHHVESAVRVQISNERMQYRAGAELSDRFGNGQVEVNGLARPRRANHRVRPSTDTSRSRNWHRRDRLVCRLRNVHVARGLDAARLAQHPAHQLPLGAVRRAAALGAELARLTAEPTSAAVPRIMIQVDAAAVAAFGRRRRTARGLTLQEARYRGLPSASARTLGRVSRDPARGPIGSANRPASPRRNRLGLRVRAVGTVLGCRLAQVRCAGRANHQ